MQYTNEGGGLFAVRGTVSDVYVLLLALVRRLAR